MSVTVRAPSTTANLGPGFDIFGLALDAFFDEITITKQDEGIEIITDNDIPTNPAENTAGLVVQNMKEEFSINDGIKIEIKKEVPAGFGMGSSAASAAAAVVAMNKLFELDLDGNTLVRLAGVGEKASAGSMHYDNVGASVLGGFVIIRANNLDVVRIEPPTDLRLCVAIPKQDVPNKKTKVSRGVIPKMIKLTDSIINMSNAAIITAGFMGRNSQLIGKSINDVIVEPRRKHMIPGFDIVKSNALGAGAFGVTISGAGPSIIAFSDNTKDQKDIADSMSRGFLAVGVDSQTIICKPDSSGATIIR